MLQISRTTRTHVYPMPRDHLPLGPLFIFGVFFFAVSLHCRQKEDTYVHRSTRGRTVRSMLFWQFQHVSRQKTFASQGYFIFVLYRDRRNMFWRSVDDWWGSGFAQERDVWLILCGKKNSRGRGWRWCAVLCSASIFQAIKHFCLVHWQDGLIDKLSYGVWMKRQALFGGWRW